MFTCLWLEYFYFANEWQTLTNFVSIIWWYSGRKLMQCHSRHLLWFMQCGAFNQLDNANIMQNCLFICFSFGSPAWHIILDWRCVFLKRSSLLSCPAALNLTKVGILSATREVDLVHSKCHWPNNLFMSVGMSLSSFPACQSAQSL